MTNTLGTLGTHFIEYCPIDELCELVNISHKDIRKLDRLFIGAVGNRDIDPEINGRSIYRDPKHFCSGKSVMKLLKRHKVSAPAREFISGFHALIPATVEASDDCVTISNNQIVAVFEGKQIHSMGLLSMDRWKAIAQARHPHFANSTTPERHRLVLNCIRHSWSLYDYYRHKYGIEQAVGVFIQIVKTYYPTLQGALKQYLLKKDDVPRGTHYNHAVLSDDYEEKCYMDTVNGHTVAYIRKESY